MLIYQNSTSQFIKDVRENRLTGIMSKNFNTNTGRQVARGELGSWQNSLTRVRDLIEIASLDDNMIVLEYSCPYNQSRIDCLLFGKDMHGNENVVLLELKQWTHVFPRVEEEGNFQEIYEVMTFTGGGGRVVPHPSQQIKGYHNYLKSFIAAFEGEPPLSLFSSAYSKRM